MSKSSVESPSFDFTNTVMSQIQALNSSVTSYTPLISKWVWSLIVLGVMAVFGYVIFGNSTSKSTWFKDLNLEGMSFNMFPEYNPSQTATYAVLLFTLMLCIQIPLLKRHFDKRLDV
jgi:hypothetical protein